MIPSNGGPVDMNGQPSPIGGESVKITQNRDKISLAFGDHTMVMTPDAALKIGFAIIECAYTIQRNKLLPVTRRDN